jgi:endo-1,4-beta-xylanase
VLPGVKRGCDVVTTLKQAAACTGRLVGTAITVRHLDDTEYAETAREFNYATAENEMKWDAIEPTRNAFNFGPGDQVVSFAQKNGMQVKGHTLVWHNQLPAWVNALEKADDVRAAMVNHIHTTVEHYKGKVAVWDVVNEAWDTDKKTGDGNPRLRDSVFFKYLGASFVDEAFKAAHAADPSAKLYYNEHSAEGINDKSNAVYGMLKAMIARGVPVHGVGLQMHIGTPNDTPTAAEVAENMQRLAALGLEIVISEMDVNSCDGHSSAREATLYHDVVAACVAQPACKAVTFWGITDKYSWLNRFKEAGCTTQLPTPLLWDESYSKKLSYRAVVDAFAGR